MGWFSASNACSWSAMSGSNKIITGTHMLLTRDTLPDTIPDIATLEDLLCRPSQPLIDDLNKVDGDIMILGVAGKMGPTLAEPAQAASPHRHVIGGVSFSGPSVKALLEAPGVRATNCDLPEEAPASQ